MIHFVFSEKDSRYLFLKYDSQEDLKYLNSENDKKKTKFRSLKEILNLTDPISILPSYKGPPITQDFLFEYHQPNGGHIFYCAKGLWQIVYNYFKENNVDFDGLESKWFKRPMKHTLEEFKEIVKNWGLSLNPRDYQLEAAYKILSYNRSVSEIATRAGKTLISYIIFRYAMEFYGVKKILMITPSIDLVKQAYSDFAKYGEFFNGECIWSQGKLVESSNLSVGTFQSLIKFLDKTSKKYNPSFFNEYDCIFVDETHRATARQIKTIISQPFMSNAKIAFGLTGTLPKPNTIDRICVHALLGAKIQNIAASDLMEAGFISKIDIKQKEIEYIHPNYINDLYIKCAEYALSDFVMKDKKKVKLENPQFLFQYEKQLPMAYQMIKDQYKDKSKEEYVEVLKKCVGASPSTNNLVIEKMMIHFLECRVDYILRLLHVCPLNTLILTFYTEYAKHLLERVKQEFPDRHVLMVIGEITPKKRPKLLKMLNDYNDCILIASYSILSTGITLGNLCYGILAESFKSDVLNMQSLGRGLGLSDLKSAYVVYDLIDSFETNKIGMQGTEKRKLYKKKKYPFTVDKIQLKVEL